MSVGEGLGVGEGLWVGGGQPRVTPGPCRGRGQAQVCKPRGRAVPDWGRGARERPEGRGLFVRGRGFTENSVKGAGLGVGAAHVTHVMLT